MVELAGQAEGEESGERARAHGGQVAEAAGQSAMADGLGRVPIEAEVAAGDGEVGGDGEFLAGTRAEQGAVVADAEAEARLAGVASAGANLAQEGRVRRRRACRRWTCWMRIFENRSSGDGMWSGGGRGFGAEVGGASALKHVLIQNEPKIRAVFLHRISLTRRGTLC